MQNKHWKYLFAAVLAVLATASFAGHPLVGPDMLAGLTLLPLALGEISPVGEIKELIQKQGEAWEEFKRTNDERLKAKADGNAISDLDAKLAKINDAFAEQRAALLEMQKKAARPGAGADEQNEEQAARKNSFERFLRKGEQGLDDIQRKAMQTGSDTDGGFLVLPEMDMTIDRIAPTISAMYRLANVVTIGSAKWEKMVKTAGMAMRRVAEGAAGGETTNPKYSKVEIEAFEAEVEPWVYNATLEDAFVDLVADLAEEAAIGFAEGAGSEFISGNGVGKARGITAYSNVANASYAWGSVGYIASGKSAAM
jgi:HK97 family phage major capsid protein